ncbi:MAG: acylneuraminate cytidylyltransferase [Oscillospiraceae bacterium]|nr:acylneuraminate cytidylyltransferase [Oscillospiraceae bacterium]
MIGNKKVIAIIPARSGSKSVKDKNIRCMNNVPMLAYSIKHALEAKYVDRVIVSTDSQEYADIARKYGAEIPFLRPAEISGDKSLDIEVFEHALKWLDENEGYKADYCVHLRPTHPVRNPEDIDKMLEKLDSTGASSVRSLSPAKQTPYKMWLFEDDNKIAPVASCDVEEAYNAPRQSLPKAYLQNACIDVVRSDVILNEHSMTGKNIHGYVMDYDFDIDTEEEFLTAERYIMLTETMKTGKKLTVVCDIDGVIAGKTEGNDYSTAFPITPNIEIINGLHRMGHKIVLFTARGYVTGIDWKETTERQMREWNVEYDELKFGKPNADIYIDDRFYDLEDLKALINK